MLPINLENNRKVDFFNKYLESRLIRRNKNVILAVTGPTGSGKSYISLKVAELWYKHNFNKPFPIENCCFSIEEVVRLLSGGKLSRGEIIIMEEGGVNLGSLDFQHKISKLFTYVLQSFRSMNIGLIINLPVLSMLNKSARLLLHGIFITYGIDHRNKVCTIKPFMHQLNQQSGKIYPKYPIGVVNGSVTQIQRFYYGLPSEELIAHYEEKKKSFVGGFLEEFLSQIEEKKAKEQKRGELNTDSVQPLIWEVATTTHCKTQEELRKKVSERREKEIKPSQFSDNIKWMRKKGYNVKDFLGN